MQVRTCVECGEYKYIEQNGRCRSCSIPAFDIDSLSIDKVVGTGEIASPTDVTMEEIIDDLEIDAQHKQGKWTTRDFKSPNVSQSLTTFHSDGTFVVRSCRTRQAVRDEHQRIDTAVRSRTEADNAAVFNISSVIASFDAVGTISADRVERLLQKTRGKTKRNNCVRYQFRNHSATVDIFDDGTAVVTADGRADTILAIDALNDRLAHVVAD